MAEALSLVNVTAKRYMAGAADLTLRRRLLLALLAKNDRIRYGESGFDCNWNVQFSEPPVQPHGSSGEYEFNAQDLYRQLVIDWRGYVATDKMDYKDELMNRGSLAIIDRYARIIPNLKSSLENKFGGEFYINGNLAANSSRLHGMLTFAVAGTVAAGDVIAVPAATYGGKSTAPQDQGGSWSANLTTKPNATLATDWPDGNGTTEYDYLAPVLINTSSTNWGTGSTIWEDNCGRILRRASTWLTKNAGQDGKPTVYVCAADIFNGYQNYQEAKFRNIIPHPEGRDLGFPDTLSQDGVMVKYEFDVAAGEFWGVNVFQMEMASLDDVMWGVRGPTYDIKSDSTLFKAGFFGNMRYQPKYFCHGKARA